jgi:hypothetical protein
MERAGHSHHFKSRVWRVVETKQTSNPQLETDAQEEARTQAHRA